MKVSEALEKVSQIYVPGVVKYYGKMDNDPWQQMHDDLEQIIGIQDEDIVSAACTRFVSRAQELIDRFKRDHGPSKSFDPADAFTIGNEDRHNNQWSVRRKRCALCSGGKDLTLEPVGPNALEVRVICASCKSENARSA